MFSKDAMRRLIGLLGSWALFVLGLGLTSIALAGQWINIKDSRKLERYAVIERLLNERVAGRSAELHDARGTPDGVNPLFHHSQPPFLTTRTANCRQR